jgi:hypothetical protein
MKTLDKSDVLDIAADLIQKNGSTTSLEVKTELRNLDFFATQQQVSDFLNELYLDDELEYTQNNNGYRDYHYPVISNSTFMQSFSSSQASSSQTSTPIVNVVSGSYVKRDGKVIQSNTIGNIGDYRVWNIINTDVQYYPSTFTRSEVRAAHAKITGVHFYNTRIKRVK